MGGKREETGFLVREEYKDGEPLCGAAGSRDSACDSDSFGDFATAG